MLSDNPAIASPKDIQPYLEQEYAITLAGLVHSHQLIGSIGIMAVNTQVSTVDNLSYA